MNPLHATIEEFTAEGYTHIECFCPRCRVIRLRPISWLPKIFDGADARPTCPTPALRRVLRPTAIGKTVAAGRRAR